MNRIQAQKDQILPAGKPDHIYYFPEKYDLENSGWYVTNDEIRDSEEVSGVSELDEDFLSGEFRKNCEAILPSPTSFKPNEWKDAYIFLRETFVNSQ